MANEAALKITATIDSANAEIEQLKAKVISIQDANRSASAAAREMGSATRAEMREAQHAVHLLGDEIGVKVPRHLRGVIASLPGFAVALSAAFAPAAAFALLEIVTKVAERIGEIKDELEGYTKEVKKFMKEAVDANERALREFNNTDLGKTLISQTNASLEEVARKRQELLAKINDKNDESFQGPNSVIGSIILAKQFNEVQAEEIKLQERLLAQHQRESELEQKAAEKRKKDADDRRKELEKLAKAADEAAAKIKAVMAPIWTASQTEIEKIQLKYRNMAEEVMRLSKAIPGSHKKATEEVERIYEQMFAELDQKAQEEADALNKILADSATKQIQDVLSIPVASVTGPMEQYKDLVKDTTTALEAERAQEQALAESVRSGNLDEITGRQKLNALHRETVDALRDQVTEIQRIAIASKDESLINEAKRLSAELDKLNAKVRTVGQSLKVEIEDKFTDAFASIVTGTQSAADAFRSMAQAIIAEIAKIIAKMLVLRAVNAIVGVFSGSKAGTAGAGDLSGLLGPVTGVAGHASGGFFEAGVPFIAGEEGPEPIFPSTSGRVMPAYALRGNASGGTVIMVDARGAEHGAEQRIMRAFAIMQDHTIAKAVKVISESRRRSA